MSIKNVKLDSFWKSCVQKVQQNKKLLWAMAAFWLVIALALCAVYFAVDGEVINGNANPGLTSPSPGVTGAQTGDGNLLNTSTTTDPSTTDKIIPIIGPIIFPRPINKTNGPTGSTQPPTLNGTVTPSQQNATKIPQTTSSAINGTKSPTNVTMPSTDTTTPSTDGTQFPTTGTTPPSTGSQPSTTGTMPPPTGTTSPTSGASPPIPPRNPQPPVVMPPTAWIYPSLLWPPMRQPSYSSSVESFDQSMSDQSGDVLIEDFKETITIHKKTFRKHKDTFEKENSDMTSSDEVDYKIF